MLREEVLREWRSCKEKVIDFKQTTLTQKEMKLLKLLADTFFFEGHLPYFDSLSLEKPLSLDELVKWTSADYQQKLEEEKFELMNQAAMLVDEEINESLDALQNCYLSAFYMFRCLTKGWKDEIDSRGPHIEEID